MNDEKNKEAIAYSSLILAAVSLFVIFYVKWRFVFEYGNAAVILIWISILAGFIGLVLGILVFPRWQSVMAVVLVVTVACFIIFTPLYALS